MLLQPAAAMVLAAAVLGERPTLVQVGGALLVCGGVLVASRAQAPRRDHSDGAAERGDPVPARSARPG